AKPLAMMIDLLGEPKLFLSREHSDSRHLVEVELEQIAAARFPALAPSGNLGLLVGIDRFGRLPVALGGRSFAPRVRPAEASALAPRGADFRKSVEESRIGLSIVGSLFGYGAGDFHLVSPYPLTRPRFDRRPVPSGDGR